MATQIVSQYENSVGPRPQVFPKVFLDKSSIKYKSHPTSISYINNNVAHTNFKLNLEWVQRITVAHTNRTDNVVHFINEIFEPGFNNTR